MSDDYQFDDVGEISETSSSKTSSDSGAPARMGGYSSGGSQGSGRSFADELDSVTIQARSRTFYIDLKQSANGKFVKVSEKSRRGQKTTIMMDSEDLPQMIEALQRMQKQV